MNRRKFIKSLLIAGATVPVMGQVVKAKPKTKQIRYSPRKIYGWNNDINLEIYSIDDVSGLIDIKCMVRDFKRYWDKYPERIYMSKENIDKYIDLSAIKHRLTKHQRKLTLLFYKTYPLDAFFNGIPIYIFE